MKYGNEVMRERKINKYIAIILIVLAITTSAYYIGMKKGVTEQYKLCTQYEEPTEEQIHQALLNKQPQINITEVKWKGEEERWK